MSKPELKISLGHGILPSALVVLFTYLKLTGQIDWSWFWVFFPITLPFIILFSILLIWLGLAALVAVLDHYSNRRRRRW